MAVSRNILQLPGKEYSQEEELRFRRQLEEYLQTISTSLSYAESLTGQVSSLASKRDILSVPEVGITEVGNDEAAYYSAHVTVPATGTSCAPTSLTYATVVSSWTEDHANNWAESSGNFTYTGNGTRRFLVTWTMLCLYSSYINTAVSLVGKITKTPSGGSAADVAGSEQRTPFTAYLTTAFLTSYFYNQLSGSTMVEVANGDSIQCRYGFWSQSASTKTVTVLSGYGASMVVYIVPADNLP